MKNIICIIAGEPNSINSEIIAKAWKKKLISKKSNIFVIGNYNLIKYQLKKIKIKIKIKKVSTIEKQNFKKSLLILDVPLNFKNPFKIKKKNKKLYILKSFKIAINLVKQKKVLGLINCPINKTEIFDNKDIGVTEFLAKKEGVYGQEAMLIYNQKLSVVPVTTHIKVKNIAKQLSKRLLINKSITINKFFMKRFNIKPRIGILGLNPHNYELRKNSEEKKIIIPAIKILKRRKIFVNGPLSSDTAFIDFNKKKFDVLVGMYHDQVLSPFKAMFKFDAINITLGLPYIRISPDHGTGKDIITKNIANPESLIKSIRFLNKINVGT